jgi:hypothetical protein
MNGMFNVLSAHVLTPDILFASMVPVQLLRILPTLFVLPL